jgi:hypothetical protein
MSGVVIAQLILQYGIPAAEAIWKMVQSTTPPTQSDWDSLKALTSQTAKDRTLAQLKAAGIDPTSPQGVALLALVS